jgi:hypothetical protein
VLESACTHDNVAPLDTDAALCRILALRMVRADLLLVASTGTRLRCCAVLKPWTGNNGSDCSFNATCIGVKRDRAPLIARAGRCLRTVTAGRHVATQDPLILRAVTWFQNRDQAVDHDGAVLHDRVVCRDRAVRRDRAVAVLITVANARCDRAMAWRWGRRPLDGTALMARRGAILRAKSRGWAVAIAPLAPASQQMRASPPTCSVRTRQGDEPMIIECYKRPGVEASTSRLPQHCACCPLLAA